MREGPAGCAVIGIVLSINQATKVERASVRHRRIICIVCSCKLVVRGIVVDGLIIVPIIPKFNLFSNSFFERLQYLLLGDWKLETEDDDQGKARAAIAATIVFCNRIRIGKLEFLCRGLYSYGSRVR